MNEDEVHCFKLPINSKYFKNKGTGQSFKDYEAVGTRPSLDEWHVLGHVLSGDVLRQLAHEVGEDGLVVRDVGAHL